MPQVHSVLGIDLASRRWSDNGTAILRFSGGTTPAWESLQYGCLSWPGAEIDPVIMSERILSAVSDQGIRVVCLDGPQGWREPGAPQRKGVGRVCEYQTKCQGKTGEYGQAYPRTQKGWIHFCTQVFAHLRDSGRAVVANDVGLVADRSLDDGQFWILETFPTASWRQSGLTPLPAKSRVGRKPEQMLTFVESLRERFHLPNLIPWTGTHDDLQAIVTALPAVGLLQGPCRVSALGKPGWLVPEDTERPGHWVEGLIWVAQPHAADSAAP